MSVDAVMLVACASVVVFVVVTNIINYDDVLARLPPSERV